MSALARAEFAALLREAFLEVASKGYEAHAIGMSEEQLLTTLGSAMEPVVQSIMRKVGGTA